MNLNYTKNQIDYWSVYLSQISEWQRAWKLPTFQAHRGYWLKNNKQNSFESLSEAKTQGFEMAEFDVQITKDGIPVVFHDFDLSHVVKKNVLVSELKYNDLKDLYSTSTLLEILLSKNRPLYLNVEIKSKSFLRSEIEEKVCEVIKKTKTQEQIIFSSFNHWSLMKVKNILPEIPRALLVTDEPESWNKEYLKKMWLMPLVQPTLIHFNHESLNSELVSFFKEQGLLLSAWTVNDPDRANLLLSMGVDSIITDALVPYKK
jgi:glycerophosphoryl diester phosphodiesterase